MGNGSVGVRLDPELGLVAGQVREVLLDLRAFPSPRHVDDGVVGVAISAVEGNEVLGEEDVAQDHARPFLRRQVHLHEGRVALAVRVRRARHHVVPVVERVIARLASDVSHPERDRRVALASDGATHRDGQPPHDPAEEAGPGGEVRGAGVEHRLHLPPLVRRGERDGLLCGEHGLRLHQLQQTGPGGSAPRWGDSTQHLVAADLEGLEPGRPVVGLRHLERLHRPGVEIRIDAAPEHAVCRRVVPREVEGDEVPFQQLLLDDVLHDRGGALRSHGGQPEADDSLDRILREDLAHFLLYHAEVLRLDGDRADAHVVDALRARDLAGAELDRQLRGGRDGSRVGGGAPAIVPVVLQARRRPARGLGDPEVCAPGVHDDLQRRLVRRDTGAGLQQRRLVALERCHLHISRRPSVSGVAILGNELGAHGERPDVNAADAHQAGHRLSPLRYGGLLFAIHKVALRAAHPAAVMATDDAAPRDAPGARAPGAAAAASTSRPRAPAWRSRLGASAPPPPDLVVAAGVEAVQPHDVAGRARGLLRPEQQDSRPWAHHEGPAVSARSGQKLP
eukprot:CAMPEP_0176278278 /NCGR_PEP_ID=MMETSP0121_2-20121125/48703_1 /TAXON_ID=160619 /ORGANISM="Kryptoperidinium foliaceum, Strain CCMP 1326" /LENGTH=563 /DNA_ID=CAMNT_0017618589 /DNA_START=25 /DNA_END=1715 /DNA_ORIENTATION=+